MASRKKPPSKLQKAVATLKRQDSWSNTYTGLGTTRDKMTYSNFEIGGRITDAELSALYNENDIAARMVNDRPKQILRQGYEVKVEDDGELGRELKKAARKLKADKHLLDTMIWGRLYGGAIMIIGADDGKDPSEPLKEERIRSIKFLNVVDRRYVHPVTFYEDPLQPNYGEPEIYRVQAMGMNSQSTAYVHESRVLRFDGADTDAQMRRQLRGWTLSTLQRPYEVMRDFSQAFQAAGHLLSDASQGVIKLKGLWDIIASDGKDGLVTRMQMVDMTRSVARSLILDADGEEFSREPTSFTGIPDILDRFMMRLSAACEVPVAILLGRSAAGLNATGDSDFRAYYDSLKSSQRNELEPLLRRFYTILCAAKDSPTKGEVPEFEFEFAPLWQPTDGEVAAAHLQQAQADNLYLQQGVLLPEEVALSRFGEGGYSLDTHIDVEAREEALKADIQEMLDQAKGLGMQPQFGPDGQPLAPSNDMNPGGVNQKANAEKPAAKEAGAPAGKDKPTKGTGKKA